MTIFFCEKPESDPDPEQRFSVLPQEFEVSSDAYYRRLYFVSSSWFRLSQSVRPDDYLDLRRLIFKLFVLTRPPVFPRSFF